MQQYFRRPWWLDVARGSLYLASGIIFVFTPVSILVYVLGLYLILDGGVDLCSVARGRGSRRHVLAGLLLSLGSIAIGALSFLEPSLTLLLVALVMLIYLFRRAGRALRDAWHTAGRRAGLIWLYGAGACLVGLLSLLLLPLTLLLTLFVLYLTLLCDGLYLLVRGLLQAVAPAARRGLSPTSLLDPADPAETLPTTTRRAIVFVRRRGARGLGHVGWSFEWQSGWFNAGSVENAGNRPFSPPQAMGFWAAHTLDPVATMRKLYTYDAYKIFAVVQPRPREAWGTVVWESRQPYSVVRHNCCDVVYDVLRAYGITDLNDPALEQAPNDWYDDLPARSLSIEEYPQVPLRLRTHSTRELVSREIQLSIPWRVVGSPPPWRQQGQRAWTELLLAWQKMLRDIATLCRPGHGRRSTRE
jgi:uncharacterized membrane protein HdeD (DUF308 family)